jgi:hypothetical protein
MKIEFVFKWEKRLKKFDHCYNLSNLPRYKEVPIFLCFLIRSKKFESSTKEVLLCKNC